MIGVFGILRGGLLIGLWVVLIGASGCMRHPADHMNPFPASNEITGWTRTGVVRTYAAADLWKYIDGEAERYLKAGAQSAFTADYRFNNKFDAVADVYNMGSAAGAEQIFHSEPTVGAENAALGDAAHLFGQSLVFQEGRYLVRVTAYEESAETRTAILALGHGIEQRLTK